MRGSSTGCGALIGGGGHSHRGSFSSSVAGSGSGSTTIVLRQRKQVHFRPDVKVRVRPSASNMRPLSRLARREAGHSNPFIKSLESWDLDWRQYLRQYYDDSLYPTIPSEEAGIRSYFDYRDKLVLNAEECYASYMLWRSGAAISDDLMIKGVADRDCRCTLERLLQSRTVLVQRMLEAVQAWQEVEQRRWSSVADLKRDPSTSHESFCEFVDRVDALQRKYKALCDSVRRVTRKAKKAEAEKLASMDKWTPPGFTFNHQQTTVLTPTN